MLTRGGSPLPLSATASIYTANRRHRCGSISSYQVTYLRNGAVYSRRESAGAGLANSPHGSSSYGSCILKDHREVFVRLSFTATTINIIIAQELIGCDSDTKEIHFLALELD